MNFRPAKSVAGLIVHAAASGLLGSLMLGPASAAELQFFQFRTSYKGVKADPEKIWQADDLVSSSRPVEIHEYTLAVGKDVLLVSQIWNDNCSIEVCPTRLVRIADGKTSLLVDDMMHPIVPAGEPIANTPAAKEFQAHPFQWDAATQTLRNGDFRFSARK